MPSDLLLKSVNRFHRSVVKLTRGRIGWKAGAMPVVELTTVGRKSGERRTVMLTSPTQEGDSIVIVASRGGDDRHPAWYLNLVEHPEVEVSMKGVSRRPMLARVATADERSRLWPMVTSVYKGYGGYQNKTEREIPLVFLDPPAAE